MKTIVLNNRDKAERIISAGRKTHRMHWQKIYGTDTSGGLVVRYLIFYIQKGA